MRFPGRRRPRGGGSMSGRVLPLEPAEHKVADVLLPWIVNGTLDKDELAFVEQHLSECVRCQREVQWLRELRAACVDGEAAPGASAVFRNLRRQLDEPRAGRGKVASLSKLWRRVPTWSRWAMAAQLAAIVALGAGLLLSLCAVACARLDRVTGTPADDGSTERQVLVMLHLAPPHFRPDVAYGGSYDARAGGSARRRIAEAIASQYSLTITNDWPMPALGVDCFVMQVGSNASLPRLVEQLSLDPRVESAQSMNLFRVLAHNDPLYPLQPSAKLWHLAELHKITTGRYVRVAEVDTGVELDHPDLSGRVVLARNFVDGRQDVAEQHGTAAAGIIAARADDRLGIAGIAPEAKLMALRACWQELPG